MRQTRKITQQGSLINNILGNNDQTPVVGEYAIQLLFTDRRCYKVVAFDAAKKTMTLCSVKCTKYDECGYGIEFEDGVFQFDLKYKYGAWRHENNSKINFCFQPKPTAYFDRSF